MAKPEGNKTKRLKYHPAARYNQYSFALREKPIHTRAVTLILLLSLLFPALSGPADAVGETGGCAPSRGTPGPAGAGFGGGACHPGEDSGCPDDGGGAGECSCESCQPFFAAAGEYPVKVLPGMERVEASDPSDPSASVPSEVFRPPLA